MCVYVQIFIFCTQSHFGIVNFTKKECFNEWVITAETRHYNILFLLERHASATFYKFNPHSNLGMVVGF